MKKRILVTGSRNWKSRADVKSQIKKALEHLETIPEDTVLVHGDARGLDKTAASVAKELRLEVEAHPADWEEYGRRAGVLRNQEMVELGADILLAFPTESSIGTWDAVRRAEKAGIETWILKPRC